MLVAACHVLLFATEDKQPKQRQSRFLRFTQLLPILFWCLTCCHAPTKVWCVVLILDLNVYSSNIVHLTDAAYTSLTHPRARNYSHISCAYHRPKVPPCIIPIPQIPSPCLGVLRVLPCTIFSMLPQLHWHRCAKFHVVTTTFFFLVMIIKMQQGKIASPIWKFLGKESYA